MMEQTYSGDLTLTENVTIQQIEQALANELNQTVQLARDPKDFVIAPESKYYIKQVKGKWVKRKKR